MIFFKDTGKLTAELAAKRLGKHGNPVLGAKHDMDEDLCWRRRGMVLFFCFALTGLVWGVDWTISSRALPWAGMCGPIRD